MAEHFSSIILLLLIMPKEFKERLWILKCKINTENINIAEGTATIICTVFGDQEGSIISYLKWNKLMSIIFTLNKDDWTCFHQPEPLQNQLAT